MLEGAVRKKRPCCVCRRWFLPDARVGDRQRACGAAECQRARHREADRAWHARHRDYDRGLRWQVAVIGRVVREAVSREGPIAGCRGTEGWHPCWPRAWELSHRGEGSRASCGTDM